MSDGLGGQCKAEQVAGTRDYIKAASDRGSSSEQLTSKTYNLEWYFINAGPSGGDAQYLVTDQIKIEGSTVKLIATQNATMPNLGLRNRLTASIKNGTITLEGELDLGNPNMTFNTVLVGSIHSGFGYGVWEQGDVYVFKLIEE